MSDHDAFAERGRALEEEYFRRKNRELVEKMRRDASNEEARHEMGVKTGLHDPEMLNELQALGFSPDTISLLPLMPVIQMAWGENAVTDAERAALVKLARARGITDGSAADRQLSVWLSQRPDADVFTRATRLIRAMLDAQPQDQAPLTADDLVKYCETIAAASGGILGLNRVSAEERDLLATIAEGLKKRTP
jgi:hypothetical protein